MGRNQPLEDVLMTDLNANVNLPPAFSKMLTWGANDTEQQIEDGYLFACIHACCDDGTGRVMWPEPVKALITSYAKTAAEIPKLRRRQFLDELKQITGRELPPMRPTTVTAHQDYIEPGRVPVTFFPNQYASTKTEEQLTLDELAERMRGTMAPSKAELPFAKFGRFGEQKSDRNCLRTNQNMRESWGLEADYDGPSEKNTNRRVTLDEAVAVLREYRVKALVYNTSSYTDENPRWRIMAPFSHGYSPAQRAAFMDHLNGVFRGIFAGESWVESQSYYYGAVAEWQETDGIKRLHVPRPIRVEVTDGDYLDCRPELPSIPKPGGHSDTDSRLAANRDDPGPEYTVEQLRQATKAAIEHGAVTHLHWMPDLVPLLLSVLVLNVIDDENMAERIAVMKEIAAANKVSGSITDSKLDALVEDVLNGRVRAVTGGTFIHYAKLGGFAPPHRPTSASEMFGRADTRAADAVSEPFDPGPDPSLRARFAGIWPDEFAALPDIEFWDEDKRLIKSPDGAVEILGADFGMHKTNVAITKLLDAAIEKGARVLYAAGEGATGVGKQRLPAHCAARGIDIRELAPSRSCVQSRYSPPRPRSMRSSKSTASTTPILSGSTPWQPRSPARMRTAPRHRPF
jgi:hypothetical protein